jgi:hypothetical protein
MYLAKSDLIKRGGLKARDNIKVLTRVALLLRDVLGEIVNIRSLMR